jgi:hypothetical protein
VSIHIRLISDDVDELIAVSRQLGTCLGGRVELNRLRDSHRDASILYGTWYPAPPATAEASPPLVAPAAWPPHIAPIQIRLISGDADELTRASAKLAAGLDGQADIHPARDARNGEWIVYGTWTPAPPLAIVPLEPAHWPESQVGILEAAYS